MSFPITCTACHKTFTISDEIYEKKVAGRVVTIKCKACGQGIRVDGTGKASAGAQPAAAAPEAAPAAPPAPAPAAAPAAPAPAAPAEPEPAAEPLWAVDYADGQDREFTTAEVVTELERGVVNGETLVWREGMGEWLELRQVPELAGELTKLEEKKKKAAAAAAAAKAAAEAAAAAKAAAATPVHKPRARMPTVAGIGGYKPKADSLAADLGDLTPAPEPPAVTPKAPVTATPMPGAKMPATATPMPGAKMPAAATPMPGAKLPTPKLGVGELPRPRAAFGSASDLGKTPQAPAGALPKPPAPPAPKAPPAPAAAAPPPPPPPIAESPTPVPSPAPPAFETPPLRLPSPPNVPAATPPLPDSVAKVVSRPPEVPGAFPGMPSAASAPIVAAPFAPTPAIVTDHASVEWPEAKSKKPLIIGGLVALVVVIGIVAFAMGGKPETPPATSIAASPPTPTPTATTPEAPAPEAPATPPASPPSGASDSSADTASGSDPIAAGNNATPGAGFAELFAAGARKAETKGGAAPAQRFDVAATKTPLAKAATEAQSCKQSGGPTGKVTVVVTFDPSGKVASATVSEPPFAGTSTGTCIASTLKRVTIPPFSGLPGSVSKTFSIL